MMFRPVRFNFRTRQGDTFNPVFPLRDQNGGAVNPDGWEAVYRLIETAGSSSLVLERTISGGGILTGYNAQSGLYYLQPVIAAADTADLDPKRYQCELRVTTSAGTYTAGEGTHTIERQFHRD